MDVGSLEFRSSADIRLEALDRAITFHGNRDVRDEEIIATAVQFEKYIREGAETPEQLREMLEKYLSEDETITEEAEEETQ